MFSNSSFGPARCQNRFTREYTRFPPESRHQGRVRGVAPLVDEKLTRLDSTHTPSVLLVFSPLVRPS
jgi:hypothetical protein